MDSKKRKRKSGSDRPTLDEFHAILKQLAPNQAFTNDSVDLLRTAYFSYLREVASTLVQHDKITNDDGILAKACGLDSTPEFMRWVREAEELLKSSTNAASHPKQNKRSKKLAVTAEMEAQQELLFKKSKDVMAERKGEK